MTKSPSKSPTAKPNVHDDTLKSRRCSSDDGSYCPLNEHDGPREELTSLHEKLEVVLESHEDSPHAKPTFEKMVAWLLHHWLHTTYWLVEWMRNDEQMKLESPVAIASLEHQARCFFSLLAPDTKLQASAEPDAVAKTAYEWLASGEEIPPRIHLPDEIGNFFILEIDCGCLANGGGAIFTYLLARGARIRAIVKLRGTYSAWIDEHTPIGDRILSNLEDLGVNPVTLSGDITDCPVPGIGGAELIYWNP